MTGRVGGKIALVTGAAGGLGGASARALAAEGATVIMTDLADDGGQEIASEIGAEYHHLDVTDLDAWEALVADVEGRHGGIDALVHFAGTEGPKRSGLDTTLDAWNLMLKINLTGSFLA